MPLTTCNDNMADEASAGNVPKGGVSSQGQAEETLKRTKRGEQRRRITLARAGMQVAKIYGALSWMINNVSFSDTKDGLESPRVILLRNTAIIQGMFRGRSIYYRLQI